MNTKHHQVIPAVITLMIIIGAYTPSSYSCVGMYRPLPYRIVVSEAIVLGHTISVQKEDIAPGKSVELYTFQIEEVFKGGHVYQPGDIIEKEYRIDLNRRSSCYEPPPFSAGDHRILFLTNLSNPINPAVSTSHVFPYIISPTKKSAASLIKRMAAISTSPADYIHSRQQSDIETILAWLQWNFFEWDHSRSEPKAKPGASDLLDRDSIIEFLTGMIKQPDHPSYLYALDMLARFNPDLAFPHLMKALDHSDLSQQELRRMDLFRVQNLRDTILKALGRVRDPSVVPLILNYLGDLQMDRGRETQQLPPIQATEGNFNEQTVWAPDPEYKKRVAPYIQALGEIGDPRAVPFLLEELGGTAETQAIRALAKIDDPRMIKPLLERVWENREILKVLENYSDFRIASSARQRFFDHEHAPMLLASQGEPADKEWMHHFIRRGLTEGILWAAVAKDQSAKPLLMDALKYGDCFKSMGIFYALGRLRAFEVITPLLEGEYRSHVTHMGQYTYFMIGLLDEPFHMKNSSTNQFWSELESRMLQQAELENWSDSNLALALKLHQETLQSLEDIKTGTGGYYGKWSPPKALPNMPDPFYADTLADFLIEQFESCQDILQTGTAEDKIRVLIAARKADINLLDSELAMELLLDRSPLPKSEVSKLLRSGKIILNVDQVKRWALKGDYSSTSNALRYMSKHPQRENIPIIIEVFELGWHLYDHALHEVIIENRVTELIHPLQDLLHGEPLIIRTLAKSTLDRLVKN